MSCVSATVSDLLELRLQAKEDLLLQAQEGVAHWSKQRRQTNLTKEEKNEIEQNLKDAKDQQAELKAEIQELKADIQQQLYSGPAPTAIVTGEEKGKLCASAMVAHVASH